MARYIGPKNRLSRREGADLFGRGHKLRRASIRPGQHTSVSRRRLSDYGVQLREKQKVKRIYGILERQFHSYFSRAASHRGSTGEALLCLLETRLDNVVYRLGLVPSRAMARQLVGHNHVLVNNQVVNIPSYQVKVGEIITLGPKIGAMELIKTRLENSAIMPPPWLNRQAAVGQVSGTPSRADIDKDINEQLIVEYYSR